MDGAAQSGAFWGVVAPIVVLAATAISAGLTVLLLPVLRHHSRGWY